jgi:hypothetical protein
MVTLFEQYAKMKAIKQKVKNNAPRNHPPAKQ